LEEINMQEVYAALLLHSSKQPINEENLKKVISSTGGQVEDTKIKALVASLDGVNIDEAIAQAAVAVAAAPAAGAAPKKEEKPAEDESKKAEEAAAGLSALFG
jgi:large subunit ribosomal protein L12